MRICGIDPGAKGAMCVLDSTNPTCTDIFEFHRKTPYAIANWLYHQQVDCIWLEDVHALHGSAAKATFNFGKNVGYITAISHVIIKDDSTKFHLVKPKIWQKFVGVTAVGSKLIKPEVAQLAQSLFPNTQMYGPKGGLKDGVSDACMIAYYGLHNS